MIIFITPRIIADPEESFEPYAIESKRAKEREKLAEKYKLPDEEKHIIEKEKEKRREEKEKREKEKIEEEKN